MVKNFSKGPLDALMEASHKFPPLKALHRAIEANDTFVRTPKTVTNSRVHVRDGLDTKRLMSTVIVALIPCLLFAIYNAGYQKLNGITETGGFTLGSIEPNTLNYLIHGAYHILPMVAITYFVGLHIEMIFACVRDHEVNEGFLVSGMLIPLTMPPDAPLWMIAVSTAFGVIIGKEVFGGTGMNFLNPALTARAFMFFSYPTAISGDQVWKAVDVAKDKVVDGYSAATALLEATSAPREVGPEIVAYLEGKGFSFLDLFLGLIPGSAGETSTLIILIGAAILLITGVGSMRIMLSTVIGALVMGWIFNMFASPDSLAIFHLPAYYHLVMGSFAFGTVFMATDPVSAAATPTGRIWYGFFIGVLAVLIRAVNPAYPEGMMLAILFMNMFAPFFDHYVIKGNIKRRLARG